MWLGFFRINPNPNPDPNPIKPLDYRYVTLVFFLFSNTTDTRSVAASWNS